MCQNIHLFCTGWVRPVWCLLGRKAYLPSLHRGFWSLPTQVQQANNCLIIHSDPEPLLRNKEHDWLQILPTDQGLQLNSLGAGPSLQLEAASHAALAVWHAKQVLPCHRAVEISDTARSQSRLWWGQDRKDVQSLEEGAATQPNNQAIAEAPGHLTNPTGLLFNL